MAGILVADKIGSEVVYSTTCFENGYNTADGTHTFFEISKEAIRQPQLLSGVGASGAVKYVDASLTVVEGFLAIGMVFTPPPASIVFGALAGVGALIQAGLGFLDDGPDPMQEKLEQLTQKIGELDGIIKARFDDMKSFITENKFSVQIISEVATLKKFLRDCLSTYSAESIENFGNAYYQNTPLDLVYILLSLLSQKSTNPLIMALEKEEKKTRTTFDSWKNIILTVVGDLVLIEGFASGLLKSKNSFDWDKLMEQQEEIIKTLAQWEDEYMNVFWNDFKKWLVPFIQNGTSMNNSQKADLIKKQLEKCWSDDSFYVCVLNQDRGRGDFYCHCPNAHSQLIEVRNEGRCNAFVYRSFKGNSMEQVEYDRTKGQVDALWAGKFEHDYNLEGQVKDYLVAEKYVRADGLVALMDYYCEPEIRSVNSPGHENGPGLWGALNRMNGQLAYKLIVGFP